MRQPTDEALKAKALSRWENEGGTPNGGSRGNIRATSAKRRGAWSRLRRRIVAYWRLRQRAKDDHA